MSKRNYDRSEYYVHGNTVRKHQVSENYAARLETAKDRRRRERNMEQEDAIIKVMPVRAWDIKSLLFIIAAVAVVFGMCISYLHTQGSVAAMSKEIAVLESEIMTLKDKNDAAYNRVNSSVDLSYVYDVAVNELGMVHATDNQVIPYSSRKSNSVRQYGEIPQETESTDKLFSGKQH